ncbi:MAG: hypothetical protein EOO33_16750 [Comamonadaceae bacterium]|nr:MAG: hypothetical protein EOO33_16750 [Comamonadaceae bacterium]
MSLFSWFSRKTPPARPRPSVEPSSALLNADATVPLTPGRAGHPMIDPQPPEHAANRKNERMERRELLYTVVRDAMVRAGVLSAGYKFKVLSLDQRGRQFLVMMDIAREYGGETIRLSEIEALIAQTAKSRFDILVTAVYWRINDHVAVGIPQRSGAGHAIAPSPTAVPAAPPIAVAPQPRTAPAQPPVRPAPPAPLVPPSAPVSPAPAGAPRQAPRFDPIEADEVAAFKRALSSAAAAKPPAPAAQPGVAVRSGPLLPPAPTGFEDTEIPGHRDSRSQDLSNTQYGDL